MEIINFLDNHNGSLTLVTTIVTIMVTIYIARLPYKKVVDISVVLYDSKRFKNLYDENAIINSQVKNKEDYLKNCSLAKVNVTNIGLCTLAVNRIEIRKKSFFRNSIIGSYKIDLKNKKFLSPMKQQEFKMIIKEKPDELRKDLSKLIVDIYFEGNSKKSSFRNCIIYN